MFRIDINGFSIKYFCCLFFLLLTVASSAQDRSKLKNKRKNLLREISETNALLKSAAKEQKNTIDNLMTLERKISSRKELIQTIETEISATESLITRTISVIRSLEDDQVRLQKDYSNMVRHAFRHKQTFNKLLFLFSSQNFNEGYRRWKNLQRYNTYRKKQLRLIQETRESLGLKIAELEARRFDKKDLLKEQEKEQTVLGKEVEEKNVMLVELKGQESQLKKELAAKEKAKEKLNKAIEKSIKAEVASSRKKSRSSGALPMTPKEQSMASGFKNNRGTLPWPVEKGVITGFFGEHQHPVLKLVKIKNNGIDIKTTKNAEAYSVYDGVVANVMHIPGFQNAVIIKHGNYFSTYSNLSEVFVNKGSAVSTGTAIGRVGTQSNTGKTELHFEIWEGTNHKNPRMWLLKN